MDVVIAGGNSGIGLAAAKLLAKTVPDCRLLLLGRDAAKGEAATKEVGARATFVQCDLSSRAGVRSAVEKIEAMVGKVDVLINSQGMLTLKNLRNADDVAMPSAVNALSKFMLTELLLPLLNKSQAPKVIFNVAAIPLSARISFSEARFPLYRPTWPGFAAMTETQMSAYHYCSHLKTSQPKISAACVNVGLVDTPIMREMPSFVTFMFKLFSPLFTISAEQAANNAVKLATSDQPWSSGVYLPKPGQVSKVVTLEGAIDKDDGEKAVAALREACGL